MVFSVMLIAPSWGGMINGLLTLRGAWDKLRTDVILKFFVVGITFYGMSTFEGPMMSVKTINALSHYTDWTIGHAHAGALGWNGFIAFGMIYFLMPKLWGVPVWSKRLMNTHFWLGTLGIVLYVTALWVAGVTQGLMWREFNADGTLAYPDFIETVNRLIPFYWLRALGGGMYLVGLLIMAYNVVKTIGAAKAAGIRLQDTEASAYPMAVSVAQHTNLAGRGWHYQLEGKAALFTGLTLLAVVVGGIAEIVPMAAVQSNVPTIASVKPYTALEVEGRDIYIREGCYTCHSQMVRPFRDEVIRYGEYSKAGEFVYDHPFQFGSKRTGPDLHRVGGKYPHYWHYRHMIDPRSTSPGSIMPSYAWLESSQLDTTKTASKLGALKAVGVPYTQAEIDGAVDALHAQAKGIAEELVQQGVKESPELASQELVALIAYLQRLGRDIKAR